ncbi:MAG: M81 family metallopeptidase [Chloroflexota bacterium]
MTKVLLAAIKEESNTFVPGVAGLDAFRRFHLLEGAAVFSPARGGGQEIDGVLQVACEDGIELIPTVSAWAVAGPPVDHTAHAYLRERVLAGIREHGAELAGVVLVLHGAMTTDTSDDPDGDLIAAVRDEIGPGVPIAVTFDFHCHLTAQKARSAHIIAGYHTYPHVDYVDTGARAMRLLARTIRGEVRPVLAYRKVRMVSAAESQGTGEGPMSEVMGRALAMEKEPGILAATIFPTQPWLDVTEFGWTALVVADSDEALAQAKADELARMAWERRERFLVHKTPVAEAVRQALAAEGRPFVLSDSANNVTGGAYGDGNLLLKALLDLNYQDTALLTITDPDAADVCFAAGEGAEVTLPVGGRLTPQFYQPLTVTGHVAWLSEGKYVGQAPPSPVDLGRTAVLQVGGISIVVSGWPAPTMDQGAYHCVGLEPREAKIVQVTSPRGFRTVYGPFAAGIFELDTPGPCDSNLPRLPFHRIPRPLWPFDPDLQEGWGGL